VRLFEFLQPIPCFYHGSTVPDLRTLRKGPSRLFNNDEVVFAATLPEIAIAMSGHWTDDDFTFGHKTDAKHPEIKFSPYVMREHKPGNFEKFFNQTMYLYEVPADFFHPDHELQDFEVVSDHDVPVHAFIKFKDPLSYLEASPVIRLIRSTGV
jgi:hypothetical protein